MERLERRIDRVACRTEIMVFPAMRALATLSTFVRRLGRGPLVTIAAPGTFMTVLIALCLTAATAGAQAAKVTPLMTKALEGIDGHEGTLVMVEYAPGGSDAAHRHNAYTFVYVLEGAVVMQVAGGKEVTLGPGQTFYESREDRHTVSRNASSTKSAKLLAFSVKQRGTPLTVPPK